MPTDRVICDYPRNSANLQLESEADLARRVQRLPAGTLPQPGSSAPAPVSKSRLHINVSAAGDNTIIAGSPGNVIEIYELMLWNVALKTITLEDSADTNPLQGPLTSFPANTGYYLPDQGEPHFELKDGGSFVLDLGAATQVTGFVRYKMRPA